MTSLKVVLLGEGRVGKTSISARWTANQFDDGQAPTQAAAFCSRKLMIDGKPAEVAVWDTAGQERFHALGARRVRLVRLGRNLMQSPIYYRNADAAVLVFDITDVESFRRVRSWVAELRQMVGRDIALAIAANKQDLPGRAVPDEQSRGFAAAVGAAYYRTSAKTGAGIEQVMPVCGLTQAFSETAKAALKYHTSKQAVAARPPGGHSKLNQAELLTWSSQTQQPSSSGCCG